MFIQKDHVGLILSLSWHIYKFILPVYSIQVAKLKFTTKALHATLYAMLSRLYNPCMMNDEWQIVIVYILHSDDDLPDHLVKCFSQQIVCYLAELYK